MPDPSSRRRIELLQTLGQGGFGSVYLADVYSRDDFVQRLAVKVLSLEMSADADVAARQRDEARLLARLNHDHIVRVMDLTELDGRPAVLMEYVEGVDGAELLRRGPLPVKAAVQICAAAASALDAAWSSPGLRGSQPLRVIHRDIKPANLLVSLHGGVKVLDFGIARADFDREGKTGSVQFGTARFMAPEQWLLGESSNKVDIYALGVTLVELSTGMHMERAPLDEAAFGAHMAAVREAVADSRWPLAFRQGMDRLLAGMLAFSPAARPDAGEAYEALAHLADLAPGEALIRWARRSLPPILEEQRVRWAAVPPPRLGEGPPPPIETAPQPAPVGVALAPASPVARTTSSAGRTVLASPNPGPPDTLASSRPNTTGLRRPLAPLVSGLTAAAILLVGAVVLAPRLLPARGTAEEPSIAVEEGTAADLGLDALAATEPAPAVENTPPEAETADSPPTAAPTGAPTPAVASTSESRGSRRAAAADSASAGSAGSAPAEPPVGPVVGSTGGSGASTPATPAAEPSPTATTEVAQASTATAAPKPVATVAIAFSSSPWGAQVVVDGKTVGTTPVRNLDLTAGTHTVSMAGHGGSITRTITVGGRNPTSHTWIVESNEWRSSQ